MRMKMCAGALCVLIVLLTCVCPGSETLDSAACREIFPIPRIGKYQHTVIPIPSKVTLTADAFFGPEKVRMAAVDVGDYITRRYGKAFAVAVEDGSNRKPELKIIILSPKNIPTELKSKLFASPFVPEKFPSGLRGEQSFIIRSFLADKEPTIYLISPTWQGAYYALFAAAQLIRFENKSFTFRGADVIDWPAFEARVTSDLNGLSEKMPIETQRAFIIRKAAIQRTTHGFYGYSKYTNQSAFAMARGLRLGIGYWERPTLKPPLKSFNWSDPASIKGYADIAGDYAKIPGMGLYTWHDGTDAGWWFEYLDDFWAKRDEVDRKNYPNDPTPARADAVRFDAMMKAIRKANPETYVFLTLPCYYDVPENDKLPRIELFREYLRTVGNAIPKDMKDHFYFILEEKSPESAAAYQKYLGTKVCNYRYTPLWNGGTWDINFTEAKRHDGKTDAYYYDTSALQWDLINLLASQYMWNPDLPTDESWIVNNLAPRAAFLAYGPAWKQMVQYAHANLNGGQAAKETDIGSLKKLRHTIALNERRLAEAQTLVPAAWGDAKAVIEVNKSCFIGAKEAVEKAWQVSRKEIPLEKAKFTADGTSGGDIRAAALGKGLWVSESKPLPHWIEIDLPQPYQITRLLINLPGDNGYSLQEVEIQARQMDVWKTVGRTGRAEERPLMCEFDDLRTDKLKLIVHLVWDWSKKPRNDARITGIKLYGKPLPKDPKGTLRLDGRWSFRSDAEKNGIKQAFFSQTDLTAGWQKIVVPSYWEESGLPGMVNYDGWGWYARTFELPASWKGRVLKLRFDAVDDEAEVWLNGKRVGEHRKEGQNDPNWWEEPFTFDVTSYLNWTGPNVLTVLVNDFTLGGGIWKSVFLYWGDGPGVLAPQDK
jgi:hypothetical protein